MAVAVLKYLNCRSVFFCNQRQLVAVTFEMVKKLQMQNNRDNKT